MTNTKNTKRALLSSVLALFLCFAMLLGTTYAWFTDSAASTGNKIIAGTLDVQLLMDTGDGYKNIGDEKSPIFGEGSIAQNNNAETLWEPGKTQVAYLEIKNNGSLDLKYNVTLDVQNVSKNLYEVMYYDIVEDAEYGSVTAWEGGQSVVVGPQLVSDYVELKAHESHRFALVIHMDEMAGNSYQGGEVNFDLTVLATQLDSESDNFGPDYDATAPLLAWDGSVDTSWYVAGEAEYVLDTPAKLAGLAELVNGGNSFADKTIKLGADMDLNDLEWTPIGVKDASFNANFNGNGYTIYNLNVSGTEGVGFIGIAGNAAHIERVHIVDANVVGTHYVGTVLGYGYLAANCLKYCTVENATVVANDDGNGNGDKVGAVAGWTANGNIIGNKAVDCSVFGCRDIGGVVGYVNGENRAVTVSGNSVENVTVAVIDVADYAEPEKLGTNVMTVVGRTGSAVTVQADNAEVEGVTGATTSEALNSALENEATIMLGNGEYTLSSLANYSGITIIGTEGAVIGGENASTGFGSNFGKDTTIKNITFSGSSNGVRWSYANGGTSIFENCTFAGDSTYGFHIDQSNSATFIFNNCTFVGFNAFAGDLEKVVFNNCTFLSNGNYGHTNIHSKAYFNNCTWGDETSVSPAKTTAKLYFNDVEESYHHEYIGSVASLKAFADSVNIPDEETGKGDSWTKQAVILVADIDLKNVEWTPIGNSTTKFEGYFDGQGHTISNLVINGGSSSNIGLFGFTQNGSVKNLTVNNATVTGRLNVGVVSGTPYTSTYDNITVTGTVKVEGMSYVGGVLGKNAYANVSNITVDVTEDSYVKANSIEDGTAYRTYVGGVIGFMGEGGHTVSNVTSNIDVIGTTCDVGGIVGIAHYQNNFVNITCTGDVYVTNATEAAEAEEIGGIAGVWMDSDVGPVTFENCEFTGSLSVNFTDGVDLLDNTITGKAYYGNGAGQLIIK